MRNYRHYCPECEKQDRKRRLKCYLTGPVGEEIHWVDCPDHGWTKVHEGVWKDKRRKKNVRKEKEKQSACCG